MADGNASASILASQWSATGTSNTGKIRPDRLTWCHLCRRTRPRVAFITLPFLALLRSEYGMSRAATQKIDFRPGTRCPPDPHRVPAKKRVSHEEKNSRLLHGTRGFCREPALDEMSAKCRDSAAHCAVIPFATARKHEICG